MVIYLKKCIWIFLLATPNRGKLPHGKVVCRLHKSIYGLKQALRQWYSKFSHALLKYGFFQFKSDYSLFTRGGGSTFIALLVYVDDIIITSPNLHCISELKTFLHSQFKLKDLGSLKYFVGLKIVRFSNVIVLSQRHYILHCLKILDIWLVRLRLSV
ncbi:hypothetical protein ACOSQ2_013122 [Xanthoceras sorbifolium]